MDDLYKKGLREHVEKLFGELLEEVRHLQPVKRKIRNSLSYYEYYKAEINRKEKRKRRDKKYKNTYKDVIKDKPITAGFRDKTPKVPKNPSVKELEMMIEFYQKELETVRRINDEQNSMYIWGSYCLDKLIKQFAKKIKI